VLVLSIVAALTMAGVLLWAGLAKAANLEPMTATALALGLPRGIARPAALAVTAAEIVVAVALLFRPGSSATQIGIVVLAGLFALAGLIALRRDEPIACHCFGAGGKHLGATQMIAFLPWLAGAGILRTGSGETPPAAAAAARFAALALTLAAIKGVGVWRARRAARGDRRSAQEMYAWLPSH
jgi:hypothetical protein